MSDHSPTPWRESLPGVIGDAKGEAACVTSPENAAFIITAVNCHEALVKALRDLCVAGVYLDYDRLRNARAALALVERGGQPE